MTTLGVSAPLSMSPSDFGLLAEGWRRWRDPASSPSGLVLLADMCFASDFLVDFSVVSLVPVEGETWQQALALRQNKVKQMPPTKLTEHSPKTTTPVCSMMGCLKETACELPAARLWREQDRARGARLEKAIRKAAGCGVAGAKCVSQLHSR